MTQQQEVPKVLSEADAYAHAGQIVTVEGQYRQEDVRMRQTNPDSLFQGHVVLILDDGCRVFLYPPSAPEAIRSEQEIRQYENQQVCAVGVILPRIPQEGAVQNAPCLQDIKSIRLMS